MTESVGRHASHDPGETLVLPAVSGDDEPPYVPPSTGRHASGRGPEPEEAGLPEAGPAEAGPAGPVPIQARPAEVATAAGPPEVPAAPSVPAQADGGGEGPGSWTGLAVRSAAGNWKPPAVDAHEAPGAEDDRPPQAPHLNGGRVSSAAHSNGWRPAEPAASAAASPAASTVPAVSTGPARQARPGGPSLRLVWVYPDLLSTYGDRGNLLVLTRRAQLRGLGVEAVEVKADEPVPADGDIYLLGGGEDLPQILAASRLRADGGLVAAAARGAVIFAVCAGYQLMGHEFGGVDGEPLAGLGILDITSGRGERRGVGEIVADVDPALGIPRLTGFENHQGMTRIGPGARPLAKVTLGVGNGDGSEGAYAGNVLGTYLHGPALARNPALADLLLSWAAGSMPPLNAGAEEWARQLREERLAATAG